MTAPAPRITIFSWPLGVSDFATDMHRYMQSMERQVDVLAQEHEAIAQNAMSDDEHDTRYMLLGRIEETFPRNLRYGALMTIYATVEQSIRNACSLTGDVLGDPFVEPNGGMLEGAAVFLSRTLGVEIVQGRVTWTPIVALRLLRHCVAHAAGYVPGAKHPERVRCAMRAFIVDLTEGSDGYLDIPRDALPCILDAARGWLDEVMSDCWRALVARGGLHDHGSVATK